MKQGEYFEVLETKSCKKTFFHYCRFKDLGYHKCLVVDCEVKRPIYHGYTRFIKNESTGRGKNKYYEFFEKRVSDKVNMCEGISFYFYPFDKIYSEIEWEDPSQLRNGNNQVGIIRQYIHTTGCIVEGTCVRTKNSFITCEKTRVITSSGAIYKTFIKDIFPLVTCKQ